MGRKEELRQQYRERTVVGGVYRLVNTRSGRFLLQSTDDMQGTHNWMQFCRTTDSCTLPALQQDWKALGGDVFVLEELELLEKGATQSRQEFKEDLKVLLELWDEKLPQENRY